MPKLLLFPGMAADERLLAPQLRANSNAICPPWIPAVRFESIADYARRFATTLTALTAGEPCYLAGASFGGFVASELSRHLRTRALILIGSVSTPRELPLYMRAIRPIAPLLEIKPALPLQAISRMWLNRRSETMHPITRSVIEQAADADAKFVRWACSAVSRWSVNPNPLPCPVLHIHGAKDPVLPVRLTHPTQTVHGGGHVISLSHPREVNAMIEEAISRY